MDRENLRSFLKTAEATIIRARGSLLLVAQREAELRLDPLAGQIVNIAELASELGLHALADAARQAESSIAAIASPNDAYPALDAIARVEAELLGAALPDSIDEFVDDSFDELLQ